MGLSTKQVSGDRHELHNWSQALLQSSELPKPTSTNKRQHQQPPEQLNCPRCDSTNTKFCYYNNYNKSQPRHFCKACKRHWTKGGTLRNVPVGGGRKNKRHKTSHVTTTTTAATTTTTTPSQPQFSNLSDSLYQAIHQTPIFGMGNFMGLPPNDQNLQFSFSSLNSNSDMNLSSTSNMEASIQSSNGYKCNEKAGIMDVPQSGICEAWELAGPMELQSSSYWNWNDFDSTLVGSAGDLNIAWDGEEIK